MITAQPKSAAGDLTAEAAGLSAIVAMVCYQNKNRTLHV